MRARELLREDEDLAASLDVNKLVQILSTKCSSIINCYQKANNLLYRGIREASSPVLYKTIRTDRKPVELSKTAQNIIHSELQANGIDTTRSNSAFCSGQFTIASAWGTPYIVFPLNGWSASWFEGISESGYSFNYFQELWAEANQGARKGDIDLISDNYTISLNAMFEDYPPRETNNPDLLAKYLAPEPTEVMISGPAYYAIKTNILHTSVGKQILEKLRISI